MKKLLNITLVFLTLLTWSMPGYAAKNFNIKNDTQSFLYVNGTSGNVGVGSANPGQLFDVLGTARVTNFTMSGQTPVSGYVLTASDSAGDATWSSAGGIEGWTVSGTNVYTTTGSSNVGIGTWAPRAQLDVEGTTSIVTFAGNVGIGTLAPLNLLHVSGTNGGAAGIYFNNAIPSATTFTLYNNAGTLTWNGTALATGASVSGILNYIPVFTGTNSLSDSLVYQLNGNVGIGTTSPMNAFDVNGGQAIGSYAGINTGASNGLVVSGNVGVGTWVPGQAMDINGTARVTNFTMTGQTPVSGYVLTASDSAGDTAWSPAGGIAGWTVSGGNVYITTGSNNVGIGTSTPQGGFVVTNGNMGIGTWSPGQMLDVTGTARMTGFILSNNSAANGNVLVTNSVGIGTWMPVSTIGSFAGSLWATQNTTDQSLAGGNVGIGTTITNAGAALSVMNGNVGIGTWVPGNMLQIGNGNAGYSTAPLYINGQGGSHEFMDLSSSGAPTIKIEGTGIITEDTYDVIFDGGYGSGSTGFTFRSSNGPNTGFDVNIDNNGNLGIGTISPLTKLAVVGGNVGIGTWTAAGGSLIVANGTGNVGIGSAWPGQLLDVHGTARVTNFIMTGQTPVSGYVLTASDSAGDTAWSPSSSVGTNYWNLATGGNIGISTISGVGIGTTFGNAGLTVMNGNVGIGTWAPRQALDVQGTLSVATFAGNVGIGTPNPQASLCIGSTCQTKIDSGGNIIISAQFQAGSNVFSNGSGSTFGSLAQSTNANTIFRGAATATAHADILSTSASGTTDYIRFLLNNSVTEAMRIQDNSGVANIGIGTTVPAAQLDVEGTIYPTVFYGRGTNQNVGIGSLSPGQALDVTGTVRMTGLTLSGNGAANGYVMVGNNVGIGTWMPFSTLGTSSQWTTTNVNDVYLSNNGNVGIGTTITNAGAALSVMNGNVGIGTWAPGRLLDVNGSIRATNFTMTGQTPVSGYVLTASDSAGDTAWSPAGGIAGWTVSGSNVYTTTGSNNVGIGTSTPQGGFVVTNGNVGIGTWAPTNRLTAPWIPGDASATAFFGANNSSDNQNAIQAFTNNANAVYAQSNAGDAINGTTYGSTGYAGVQGVGNYNAAGVQGESVSTGYGIWGTSYQGISGYFQSNTGGGNTAPTLVTEVQTGLTGDLFQAQNAGGASLVKITSVGNVGIGSTNPAQILDVTGTIRTTNFMMTGQTPVSGYVLTASDSAGDTAWSPAGGIAGWTVSGSNVYTTTGSNNVGIGTTTPQGGFVVTNGNVGIGTWAPGQLLDVKGTVRMTGLTLNLAPLANGNVLVSNSVGIGTWMPVSTLGAGGTAAGGIYAVQYSNPAGTFAGTENVFSFNGTNVGIGTTNAGVLLDVRGTVTQKAFQVTSAGNVGIGTSTPQGSFVVTNGNVGIGTWAPAYPLDIETSAGGGALYTNGAATINGNVAAQGSFNQSSGSGSYGWNGHSQMYSQTDGLITFYNNAGTGFTRLQLGGTTSSFPAIGASGANLIVEAADGSLGSNLGIGTSTPQGALTVTNGNVGIGTWAPSQLLDVKGTIRTTNFTMTGQTPASGYVLTASDSAGDAVWSPAGGVEGWTVSGSNVYTTTGSNNVGIGTWAPGQLLDVNGTVRMTGLALNQAPLANGNLLVSNSVGVGTWMPVSTIGSFAGSLWATQNSTDQSLAGGNVGIGTTITNAGAALSVMNGNVGIGTWVPQGALDVKNGNNVLIENGNVGIGSMHPSSNLDLWNTGGSTYSQMSMLNSNVTTPFGGNIGEGINIHTIGTMGQNYSSSGGLEFQGFTTGDHTGVEFAGFVGNASPASPAVLFTGYKTDGGSSEVDMSGTDIIAQMQAGGAPLVTFQANGKVGIGTTTPQGGLVVTNGNVGIGTWAPGQLLDVKGTVRLTGLTLNLAPLANGNVLVSNSVGIGTWMPVSTLGAGGTAAGGIYAVQYSNPAGTFAGTENVFSFNGTNVGIGTTNGAVLLDVRGTVTQKAFQVTSAGNVGIGTSTPQGGFVVTNGNVGIGTWTAAGGNLIINGGGNVGIGTAWPGVALDINGGFRTTDSGDTTLNATGGNVGIGSANPGQLLDVAGNIRGSQIIDSGITSSLVYANTSQQLAAVTLGGSLSLTGGTLSDSATGLNYWSLTAAAGNVGISTTNTVGIGTTSAGAGAGLVVMNGNVGIGTWAPGRLLDVNGTVRMTGVALNQAPLANGNLLVSNSVGVGTWMPVSTIGSFAGSLWATQNSTDQSLAGGNVGIGTTITTAGAALSIMNGNVGIGTWAPGGAFIVQNGNVGIGTTGPQYPFHEYSIGTYPYLMAIESGNAGPDGGLIIKNASGGFGSYALTVLTSTNVNSFNIEDTGYIGIGTNTPQNKLDIHGAEVIGASYGGVDTGPASGLAVQGNVGIGTWVPGAALQVNNPASSPFTVTSSGNVGIGTSANQAALSVMNGNVGIGTWAPTGTLQIVGVGNVGIGSANPGQVLDVTGNIRGSQIIDSGITSSLVYANSSQQLSAVTLGGSLTLSGGGTLSDSASGSNYWSLTAAAGNVGISTMNTVGIGTSSAGAGAGLVVMNGNVGIGTWAPGRLLDVNGTVRMMGLALNQAPLANGNVLVSNSVGVGTWMPVSTISSSAGSLWATQNSTDQSLAGGNVGIGTTITNAGAALSVMNGNVGVGTWVPGAALQVAGTGNVGVGTINPGILLDVGSSGGIRTVGIGTTVPQELCITSDRRIGVFNGAWAGVCTAPAT